MATSNFKNVHTMIGPDAKIKGPINLEQGIIIYGQVDGDVITRGSIRIAKDGMVKGNIQGSNVIIGGTIIGHVKSEGSVTLRKTSILKGDISYRKLHIEDGAQFEGQCDLVLDSNISTMPN
mgnify:CR=1 FL=1|tara:strand:+ start:70 stop:432 length:363 start_codon:yes stop_codon:yes gene_type:complete